MTGLEACRKGSGLYVENPLLFASESARQAWPSDGRKAASGFSLLSCHHHAGWGQSGQSRWHLSKQILISGNGYLSGWQKCLFLHPQQKSAQDISLSWVHGDTKLIRVTSCPHFSIIHVQLVNQSICKEVSSGKSHILAYKYEVCN